MPQMPARTVLPLKPQPALLADSLEVLRLQSKILGRLELSGPWGIRFPQHLGWIHFATQNCFLQLIEQPVTIAVEPGDLILVFPNNFHQLQQHPHDTATAMATWLPKFQLNGCDRLLPDVGQSATNLVCVSYLLERLEQTPLYASLPAFIHVRNQDNRPPTYVEYLLRLMFQEAAAGETCGPLIINRLVRLLLIKTVHNYMASLKNSDGKWLQAIADPDIGQAIALMHEQPEAPWTVAALAEKVAMSRSAFSARFTALVGRPPLEYLSEWRMHKASYLFRTTHAELKEVAAKVGYESVSAFSKAFTRWAGVAPSIYRQNKRIPTAENEPSEFYEQ